ncbi:hypothetical protein SELMODRAFT_431993 [Selaginella moellendorffii]|uniref:GEX2 N-terminal Ig-like domain-containing protein n=1 Tax=Selaginella moellendorffii TaxID=88036 RepID=D8TEM4_SELML|nr:hypothetical protein SELMODRAFT_431993 [Selaginella moellendorffii]
MACILALTLVFFELVSSPELTSCLFDDCKKASSGWEKARNVFNPNDKAMLQIYEKYDLELSVTSKNGTSLVHSNITSQENYQFVAFNVPTISGTYYLNVLKHQNTHVKGSPFEFSVLSGSFRLKANAAVSSCVGNWPYGSIFDVGETSYLNVKLYDADNMPAYGLVNFVVTVNQPSAISDIGMKLDGTVEVISFIPQIIGQYSMTIGVGNDIIVGSPFQFGIVAGNASVKNCIASWVNDSHSFKAGSLAAARVLLKDVRNNTLNFANGKTSMVKFDLRIIGTKSDTRAIPDPEFNIVPDFQTGYEFIYFVAKLSGYFTLSIGTVSGEVVNSPLQYDVTPGRIYIPACVGQFTSEPTFQAGTKANVMVKLADEFGSTVWIGSYDFTVSVEGKLGASRYISDVNSTQLQAGYMVMSFTPIAAGQHLLEIGDGFKSIQNSPLTFGVVAAEWLHDVDSFVAGEQVALRILLMDAFNNNVSEATGNPGAFYRFSVNVTNSSGGASSITNVLVKQDVYESGYVLITFNVFESGVNQVQVGGPISMANCFLEWQYGVNDFQIDSLVQFIINKRDLYNNPVADEYLFDVTLYRVQQTAGFQLLEDTSTYPLDDLNMTAMDPSTLGKVLVSFTAHEGNFQLQVLAGNISVKGSPAKFTTFVGIVDPAKGNCYGDGYTGASVGGFASFDLQLLDSTDDTAYEFEANISSRKTVKTSLSLGDYYVLGNPTPDVTLDGLYHISYTTTKAGVYNITVTWMYYVLCQRQLTIAAGPVMINQSRISGEGLQSKIARNSMQQGQRDKIRWKIDGSGGSLTQSISDSGKGYSTAYTIFDIGQYTITVTYDNIPLPGSPVKVNVISEASFPKAVDDTIWTWDEVSIAIDVLANDIVDGGKKVLTGFYKAPSFGSVVAENGKVRYTPRKGYKGNDMFIYVLTVTSPSSPNQSANGLVFVSVRTEPPEFTFWPKALIGIEGQSISTSDDFNGLYLSYTNNTELLTLDVFAEHGHLYLPGDAPQLWHDMGNKTTFGYNITLLGNSDAINKAIQNFLYIGDSHYNGNDTLMLSIRNSNNSGDTVSIPVQVLPFNDPPFISAPDYVLKQYDGSLKPLSGNTVAFKVKNPIAGISVGDPDASDIREDGRIHNLEITLETSSGSLTILLPQSSVTSAEYRLENSYMWEPCLSAIISNGFFSVQAQAVRFRGTVAECNIALSTITYNGTVDGEVLTLIVNDMGNFGCSETCPSDFLHPLIAQKLIIIFIAIPRSAWWAYMKEARIYGATVGSIGLASLSFLCIIFALGRRVSRNRDRAKFKDVKETEDDTACDETRVYNPLWIPPPGAGSDQEVRSAPNPLIVKQRQQELRLRLREIENDIEKVKRQPVST